MTIVALIPARGGSKRIQRKNIALCAGKPLLAWSAISALSSPSVDRSILSTDDLEIAEIGKQAGLEVPFIRPDSIADDAAPMLPVMRHALDWAEEAGENVEAMVLLQPTSPLRTADHIDEAIALFRSRKADGVVSVVEVPHRFHPGKLLRTNAEGTLAAFVPGNDANDKSEIDDVRYYGRNGPAILITRPDVIRSGKLYGASTHSYVMKPEDSVDIDEPFDFWLAESILHRRNELGGVA